MKMPSFQDNIIFKNVTITWSLHNENPIRERRMNIVKGSGVVLSIPSSSILLGNIYPRWTAFVNLLPISSVVFLICKVLGIICKNHVPCMHAGYDKSISLMNMTQSTLSVRITT